MKKEWLGLVVICIGIIILIPWSVMRWENEKQGTDNVSIRILMDKGQITSMPLEEYLVGVLAAEMPAEFNQEALKAQAVAARTYAVKQISKRSVTNREYDVDTTVQTQAWLSNSQMRDKWGLINYWRYRSKLEKAVEETHGLVLVDNGDYIDAYYFSSSGRKPTERAEDVWGSPRPYLKNVSSGESDPQRYVKTFTFSGEDLGRKLGIKLSRALKADDFQILSRTAAGRVKTAKVLGRVYEGTKLRELLGLPSTDIDATVTSKLTLTVYGNGHAVGMSQWGANDLGKSGQNFKQILNHFYPGAMIMSIKS